MPLQKVLKYSFFVIIYIYTYTTPATKERERELKGEGGTQTAHEATEPQNRFCTPQ